ncbi:MAG: hypothetical protein Tsb0018_05050 [Opitutales bacterium]
MAFSQECLPLDQQPSQEIHVAFSANNETYLESGGVGAYSILKNANPDDFYHFYFFITEGLAKSGISERQKKAFDALELEFQGRCKIEIIKIENLSRFLGGVNLRSWGEAGMVRIFLPELLPHLDKVIYMDCDMIVQVDFREFNSLIDRINPSDFLTLQEQDFEAAYIALSNAKMEENSIAGVLDISGYRNQRSLCEQHGICDFSAYIDGGYQYINSGLLVMDLRRLRRDEFSKRVMNWLRKNPHSQLPDQNAINAVHREKIHTYGMHYAWPYVNKGSDGSKEIKVLHYVSTFKPWKTREGIGAEIYFDYKNQSPWSDESQEAPNHHHVRTGELDDLMKTIFKSPQLAKEYLELACFYDRKDILDAYSSQVSMSSTGYELVDFILSFAEIGGRVYFSGSFGEKLFELTLRQFGDNRLETLKLLLKLGVDGSPFLKVAIEKDFYDLFNLLIEYEVNVNYVDPYGNTPLLAAIKQQNGFAIQTLVDNGACLDIQDTSLLNNVVKYGAVELFNALIEKGLDVNSIEDSLLYKAAFNGHHDIFQILVDHGFDFERKTELTPVFVYEGGETLGEFVLSVAVGRGYESLFALLFEQDINVGPAAIIGAARRGDINLLKFLKSKGIVFSEEDLVQAIRGGSLEACKLLVEYGVHLPKGALELVVSGNHVDMLQLFVSESIDLSDQLLDRAAFLGRIEMLKELDELLQGRDVLSEDRLRLIIESGRPEAIVFALSAYPENSHFDPLSLALASVIKAPEYRMKFDQKSAMLQMLIDRGVDVNQEDNLLLALKTLAATFDSDSMIRALLQMGAKVNTQCFIKAIKMGEGYARLLLSYASELDTTQLISDALRIFIENVYREGSGMDSIELLLDLGADINAKDYEGRTPLGFVEEMPSFPYRPYRDALIEFLRKHGAHK